MFSGVDVVLIVGERQPPYLFRVIKSSPPSTNIDAEDRLKPCSAYVSGFSRSLINAGCHVANFRFLSEIIRNEINLHAHVEEHVLGKKHSHTKKTHTKNKRNEVESEEDEGKEIISEKAVETQEVTKLVVSEVKERSSINDEKVSCPVGPQVLKQEAERNEKKRKKNLRRIQHRQEKNENERLKGYEEDAKKEDYNMWVPPEGQKGDGRTSLNDKLG